MRKIVRGGTRPGRGRQLECVINGYLPSLQGFSWLAAATTPTPPGGGGSGGSVTTATHGSSTNTVTATTNVSASSGTGPSSTASAASGSSASSSTGEGGAADCGNGAIDAGEDCDGADLGTETCLTQGFDSGTLACANDCNFDTSGCATAALCGNGAIDAGEQCDGAVLGGQTCISLGFEGGTLTCSASCTTITTACFACGDGNVDAGEQCDDGNTVDGDGCSAICESEGPPATWTCNATFYAAADGCDCSCGAHDPDCDIVPSEELFCNGTLSTTGTTCVADVCVIPPIVCGNGIVQTGEQCDDGNTTPGDGCSATCQIEVPATWTCMASFFSAHDGCDCGCGAHDPDCDIMPSETLYCTGVSASPGTTCVADVCVIPPVVCGNGIVQTGEQCDDGNTTAGDGCSATCQTEPPPPTWTCNALFYGAHDGCDCSCGAHDPDCDVLPPELLYCNGTPAPTGTVCNASNVCVP